ncbi:glycine receptor subunit alpha-1-like isoform X2 [Anopheles albimanus]|uniref:glycine receptor subunit alpha-1-like isoform X2 n=1 Tax=Anopheles albimanus TaxID=7167 RepID=UPI00163EB030|nr:glycine receptor subunit alpha-1-like isoform X2 [Anopheles albimanus]
MRRNYVVSFIWLLELWLPASCAPLNYQFQPDVEYDKNVKPGTLTDVSVSLYINRISGVDENKEEISFDVFLQVTWEDLRIQPVMANMVGEYVDLTKADRDMIWVPDLYIRQLREMKMLNVFEEISSLRLYENSTISLSIGATIIIKCDMDFVLYPLDVQRCPVDFSSYRYPVKDLRFRWRTENALSFPNDFGDGFFRLPKYVVSFYTESESQIVNYSDDNHSSARLEITLSREVKSYLLENYLPSTLFVSISWGSFVVVPEIVPGRMVLLVTTLLSLITMFDTVRNNSPDALELKCLEVWLISCTLFVFFALMEYFIVLFGIRYDKHWRVARAVQAQHHASSMPPSITLQSAVTLAQHQSTMDTSMNSATFQRENGLESSATLKVTSGSNKIQPTQEHSKATSASLSNIQDNVQNAQKVSSVMTRKRFRNVADVALMYAGSQRGRLDQLSLIIFPVSFLIFTISYWTMYLTESKKNLK